MNSRALFYFSFYFSFPKCKFFVLFLFCSIIDTTIDIEYDGNAAALKGYSFFMKYFIKENSYWMFKMFVNQIGMTIFAIVLTFATNQNDTLFLIVSVFSICFYMVLLYFMTWDIGFEEKIRIDGKRQKFVKLKGLYMSLFANIPNFFLATLIIVGYYCSSGFNSAGYPASPEWAVNLYGIGRLIAGLIEAMYTGIINIVFGASPWAYLIITVPSLITCTIAYIMGVKGKRFFPAPKNEHSRD